MAPNSACVSATCIYTRQKTKKNKAWSDGVFRVSMFNKKASLYAADDNGEKEGDALDSVFLSSKRMSEIAEQGGIIDFDRYLVELVDPCPALAAPSSKPSSSSSASPHSAVTRGTHVLSNNQIDSNPRLSSAGHSSRPRKQQRRLEHASQQPQGAVFNEDHVHGGGIRKSHQLHRPRAPVPPPSAPTPVFQGHLHGERTIEDATILRGGHQGIGECEDGVGGERQGRTKFRGAINHKPITEDGNENYSNSWEQEQQQERHSHFGSDSIQTTSATVCNNNNTNRWGQFQDDSDSQDQPQQQQQQQQQQHSRHHQPEQYQQHQPAHHRYQHQQREEQQQQQQQEVEQGVWGEDAGCGGGMWWSDEYDPLQQQQQQQKQQQCRYQQQQQQLPGGPSSLASQRTVDQIRTMFSCSAAAGAGATTAGPTATTVATAAPPGAVRMAPTIAGAAGAAPAATTVVPRAACSPPPPPCTSADDDGGGGTGFSLGLDDWFDE